MMARRFFGLAAAYAFIRFFAIFTSSSLFRCSCRVGVGAGHEKQIGKRRERVVETSSDSMVCAYERWIEDLQNEKLLVDENLAESAKPTRSFDGMFELSKRFLANPLEGWRSERLEYRRTTPKLALSARLAYRGNLGFRTLKPFFTF